MDEKKWYIDMLIGFKDGTQSFGRMVTLIVNSVLLGIVYFLVVGPISLIARGVKKEFLDIEGKESDTYWEELRLKKRAMNEHYRQF